MYAIILRLFDLITNDHHLHIAPAELASHDPIFQSIFQSILRVKEDDLQEDTDAGTLRACKKFQSFFIILYYFYSIILR